ncbi:MAG: hypothetical protein Q9203_005704 [Teloschistes exilis]
MPEAKVARPGPAQYTGHCRLLVNDGVLLSSVAQRKANDDEALAEENQLQEMFWASLVPTAGEMTDATRESNIVVQNKLRRALRAQIDYWEQQRLRPEDIIVLRRRWRVAERDQLQGNYIDTVLLKISEL